MRTKKRGKHTNLLELFLLDPMNKEVCCFQIKKKTFMPQITNEILWKINLRNFIFLSKATNVHS